MSIIDHQRYAYTIRLNTILDVHNVIENEISSNLLTALDIRNSRSTQCSTSGVTKAVVAYMLSCLWVNA